MSDPFSHEADKWRYGIMKLDKNGRRNIGFKHINSKHGKRAIEAGEFDVYNSFGTTKEMSTELSDMARKQKISKAELIRRYCTWGLENDK